MLGTYARVGLVLWGALLIAYAAAAMVDPGFLQSEPRHPSRLVVLPGALCIAVIGVYLVLPARVLSNGSRRRLLGGLAGACALGLLFLAPGAIGQPFRGENIVLVGFFYLLPCMVRFLLQPGERGPSGDPPAP